MKKMLELLVERLPDWPEKAQEEALRRLAEIERAQVPPYRLTSAERTAVDEALAEVEAGDFVGDAEIRALFDRYTS
ncbi:hypothetical protein [Xanthobacter pseudotagetidis]|uniref:hypothetical protein n=1 Tax=Xanthobacter pseudotagetidis TaxID=3119911 RepID=UPI00372C6F8A